MANKITAVEWLLESMLLSHEQQMQFEGLFQQAKAMEKEQNQNFYIEGRDFANYAHDEEYGGIEYWDREPMGFEQYYNETYGKQEDESNNNRD